MGSEPNSPNGSLPSASSTVEGADRLPCLFLVSVDTEEDQWKAREEGPWTVRNVRRLPRLHEALLRLGVRPTYFVTHAVATSREGGAILRDLCRSDAEAAAHCHPWSTPPFEPGHPDFSWLFRLPPRLQRRKIMATTEALAALVGSVPRTFRAGRFGIGSAALRALVDFGYLVDGSVIPLHDWSPHRGPDFRMAPRTPYRLDPALGPNKRSSSGTLLEIPLSADYLHTPRALLGPIVRLQDSGVAQRLHLMGLIARVTGARRVLMSPETASERDMVELGLALGAEDAPVIHFFLHSTSLQPGLGPFTRTEADVDALLARLVGAIRRLQRELRLMPVTYGEAADKILAGEVGDVRVSLQPAPEVESGVVRQSGLTPWRRRVRGHPSSSF